MRIVRDNSDNPIQFMKILLRLSDRKSLLSFGFVSEHKFEKRRETWVSWREHSMLILSVWLAFCLTFSVSAAVSAETRFVCFFSIKVGNSAEGVRRVLRVHKVAVNIFSSITLTSLSLNLLPILNQEDLGRIYPPSLSIMSSK